MLLFFNYSLLMYFLLFSSSFNSVFFLFLLFILLLTAIAHQNKKKDFFIIALALHFFSIIIFIFNRYTAAERFLRVSSCYYVAYSVLYLFEESQFMPKLGTFVSSKIGIISKIIFSLFQKKYYQIYNIGLLIFSLNLLIEIMQFSKNYIFYFLKQNALLFTTVTIAIVLINIIYIKIKTSLFFIIYLIISISLFIFINFKINALINDPYIFKIDPISADVWSEIKIYGANFGEVQDSEANVIVGANRQRVLQWKEDKIIFIVDSIKTDSGDIYVSKNNRQSNKLYFYYINL